ncbi:hypothetical protein AZL_b00220 (plasmid) [Azospirillum sp. B510]|nr:hypothetical protein AZL_b00220 [Azospirillum sp. B510]
MIAGVALDGLLYSQRGPTCGIYALWKALSHKELSGGKVLPPPTKHKASFPDNKTSLRSIAKLAGLTKIGEVFAAEHVGLLAKSVGYEGGKVIGFKDAGELFTLVKSAVDNGQFVMMAFSVGSKGEPDLTGLNPHWCLIFGYWEATHELAVTHWKEFFVFPVANLFQSNTKLLPFPKSEWSKPKAGKNRMEDYEEGTGEDRIKIRAFSETELATALGWKLVVI